MTAQNKRFVTLLLTVPIFMLITFVASQSLGQFNWSKFDFLVLGFLFLSTILFCELILRKVKNSQIRITLCAVVILATLFLIWAELAVGIFGTSFAGS